MLLDILLWVPAIKVKKAMGRQEFDSAFCENYPARNPKSLITDYFVNIKWSRKLLLPAKSVFLKV